MPKFCANLSMMFGEVDFLDRFKQAREAGFLGVEYLFPYDFDAAEIKSRLDETGLSQILFNMPPGDWAAGERGIACHPDRVDAFKAGVDQALAYADILGNTLIHAMAGLVPDGVSEGRAAETYKANLAYAADVLKDHGKTLVMEPINTRDMPGYFLDRPSKGFALRDEIGKDNLLVQYDIYHAQRMEGELAATIEANLPKIGHMQLADTPGRHEPGTGEINYPFLFETIDRLGYAGWIGCEYKPAGDTLGGLGWLQPYKN